MTTENVPLCTERFALEHIDQQNELMGENIYAIIKLIADSDGFDSNYAIQNLLQAALKNSATITGFIQMASLK